MAQGKPRRTEKELNDPKFNYFIACKVDVKETDSKKIGDAIKTELSSTGGSVESRRLMELKNDCIEIMCNDAVFSNDSYIPNKGGRKAEADRAIAFKKNEARSFIDLLCRSRKTLLKSEILDTFDKLNKPFEFFSANEYFKELNSYLSGLGISVIDNVDNRIPFNDFLKIDKMLEAIGKSSLYDMLDLDMKAREDDIRTASDAKYKESQKGSDLKKKQSISTLCGLVKKTLLSGAETRKVYDQYLILKNDVWDEFNKRKVLNKELLMEEYRRYAQVVVDKLRVPVSEAERIIAIGCKFFQLTIIGKTDDNTFESCPFADCGKLYVRGSKTCPHCGRALEVICWNCNNPTRIKKGDSGCPSCGATFHAHEEFNSKCQAMEQLLMKPSVEISELKSALLAVKNVVPDFSSKQNSLVFRKVREYEQSLAQRVKQEETIGTKYKEDVVRIKQLMGKREYYSALSIAKSLLVRYNSYNVDNSRTLINSINQILQPVNQNVAMAKRCVDQGNPVLAISYAAKAIDGCDDCQDARQILQKYPPRPVSNFSVRADASDIRLQWEDVKQDYVSYTVIKKIGTQPKSITDGTVVDRDLSVKFFVDKTAVPATPYFYGVFAVRYGICSAVVSSDNPVAVFPDVTKIRPDVVYDGIKVEWDNPQNTKKIEVWKKAGVVAPSRIGDGVQIESTDKGFYDLNARSESSYLIVCRYEYNKKAVFSKGITAVFKPYEKINPLQNVSITAIGEMQYKFSCDAGYVGKIKLFVSEAKIPVPTDTILQYLEFSNICKGLSEIRTTNVNGNLHFSLPKEKILFVYPIVATEQLFIVSPTLLVNSFSGFTGASYSFSNGAVRIKGVLNPYANKIKAVVSNEKYVETPKGGEEYSFTAESFRKDGFIEIKLKPNNVYYITLFPGFSRNGVESFSPPVRIDPPIDYRETVTVLYAIEYTVSKQKPFKVTISFEADSSIRLPKLLLMQGAPKPIDKNMGQLCDRIEGLELRKGLFSRKYTAKAVITSDPVATNTKFALFTGDDSNRIRLKEVRNL